MPCLTKLYEPVGTSPPAHIDLNSTTVDLVAVDQATRANCCPVQPNRQFNPGGPYGANLVFTAAAIVYQVTIVDTLGVYAGATVPNLNGDTPGDIDVVLLKMPPTSPGTSVAPAGATAAQVRAAILVFPPWTRQHRLAMLCVIDALGSLRGTPSAAMRDFIAVYERHLNDRGINPALF